MPAEARVPVESIQGAKDALTKLAKEPPATVAMRAAIAKLAPSIKAAIASGHSWDDVARVLTQSGIQVKGSTVAAYVRDVGNPKEGDTPSGRKPRRAKPGAADQQPPS